MQRGHKMTVTKQEKKLMSYLFLLNPPLPASKQGTQYVCW